MIYDKNNVFAKIIRGEIPCNKVYEDEDLIAFHDINPAAPIHILALPKKSSINYSDFITSSSSAEISRFFTKVNQIAMSNTQDFRLVTNCGIESGQSVFHFHVHILGGKKFKDL